jgi:hypothetical protein
MPKGTEIKVKREVIENLKDGDTLCLQDVTYFYQGGGYDDNQQRIIRRGPDGKLRAQRGQAMFTLAILEKLMKKAKAGLWQLPPVLGK